MRVAVIGGGLGSLILANRLAREGHQAHLFRTREAVPAEFRARDGGFTFDPRPVSFADLSAFRELFRGAPSRVSERLRFLKLKSIYRLGWSDAQVELSGGTLRSFRGKPAAAIARALSARPQAEPAGASLLPFVDAVFHAANVEASGHEGRVRQAWTLESTLAGGLCGPSATTGLLSRGLRLHYPRGGLNTLVEALVALLRERGGAIRDADELLSMRRPRRGRIEAQLAGAKPEEFALLIGHVDRARPITGGKSHPQLVDLPLYADPTDWTSCFVVHLGLGRAPAGIAHHTALLEPEFPPGSRAAAQLGERKVGLYVRCATVTDPSLAPSGQGVVSIICRLPRAVATRVAWAEEKDAWADALVAAAGRELPELGAHVERRQVFSPADYRSAFETSEVAIVPPFERDSALARSIRRAAGAMA